MLMVALERPLKLGDVVSDTLMFSFWSFFTMLWEDLLGQHFLDHYFFLICLFIQNLASSQTCTIWPVEVCTNFFLFFSGECEGCMRDDCGQCAACADKPRFGGRGTKKKACVARICRMRGPPTQGQAIVVQQDQEGQTYQIVGYIASEDIKDWTSRNFT